MEVSTVKYERQRSPLETITEDELEKRLNNKCCFKKLNILTILVLLSLTNFLLDCLCVYLSFGTVILYGFGLFSAGSLLCLCAVISAIQEEKHKFLARTTIWVGLKTIVLTALWLTALAACIEFSINDESYSISIELMILLCIVPLAVLLLCFQWWMTVKVTAYIHSRDEFYVIPSAIGSVHLRNSLKQQKLSQVDVEKY